MKEKIAYILILLIGSIMGNIIGHYIITAMGI